MSPAILISGILESSEMLWVRTIIAFAGIDEANEIHMRPQSARRMAVAM